MFKVLAARPPNLCPLLCCISFWSYLPQLFPVNIHFMGSSCAAVMVDSLKPSSRLFRFLLIHNTAILSYSFSQMHISTPSRQFEAEMLVPEVDLGGKEIKHLLNLQTFFHRTTTYSLLNLTALRSLQCLPRSFQCYHMQLHHRHCWGKISSWEKEEHLQKWQDSLVLKFRTKLYYHNLHSRNHCLNKLSVSGHNVNDLCVKNCCLGWFWKAGLTLWRAGKGLRFFSDFFFS